MSHTIALVVITPLIFSIGAFIFRKKAKIIMLVGTVVWFILASDLFIGVQNNEMLSYTFAGYSAPLGIEFIAFSLNSFILLLCSFIVMMITFYAYFYLQKHSEQLFFCLVGFLCSGLAIAFLSNDIFNIYVGLELLSLSAVSLSALGGSKKAIYASIKYLLASLLASGFYLFAVVLLYTNYSTLSIELLRSMVQDDAPTMLAYICIVLALIIKTALFPFHYWLAKAHSNALAPVSALLSAVVIKTTFYLLILFSYKIFTFSYDIKSFIGYLGLIAVFYGGVQAILAKKLKLLIAYSTISQVGYFFIVFLLPLNQGLVASILIVIAHMFAKAGLFLVAGILIYICSSKEISYLKGVSSVAPLSIFTLSFSAITLIGLPPTLGFSAKWHYLQSFLQDEQWFVFVLLLLATLVTAFYFFKIIIITLMQEKSSKSFIKPTGHGFVIMQVVAFFLSASSVMFGFFSTNIINMIGW